MDLEMRNILHAYKLPDAEVKTELEEASHAIESPRTLSEPDSPVKLAPDSPLKLGSPPQPNSPMQPESIIQLESSNQLISSTHAESPVQKQHEEKKIAKTTNKRKKTPEKLIIKKPRETETYELDSDSETDDNYTSMPKNSEKIDSVEDMDRVVTSQMVYHNEEEIKSAINRLDNEKINEKKLFYKLPGNDAEFRDDTSVNTEVSSHSLMVPDEDALLADPLGMYGLKLDFLQSLGITPPLDKWVYVTNFRCDKFELRDVMELSGQVLSCSVVNVTRRFAKVQYSHPLEAVQAISMLNGQMFYGLKLKVYLEKNAKNDIILPKGLLNIGLGLGLQGRPVRDIVRQYRKYIRRQNSSINPILFRKISCDYRNYNDDEEKTNESQMDVEEYVASSRTSTFANDRTFKIKHVEDLDSNDDVKEKSIKRNSSPESNSEKSLDSPTSNNGIKDDNKPSNLKVTTACNTPQQSDSSNVALPLSLSRGHSTMVYPRTNMPQNRPSRPQMSPAVPYRPCPPVPQLQQANVQYTGPFKPGPFCNAVPNHIPNPVINQSQQVSAAPLNYMPIPNQGPNGPGPIHRPGPIAMTVTGPVQRPGFSGPVSGPGPNAGPIHRPGPVRGSAPGTFPVAGQVSGPQPVAAIGSGPVNRPVQPILPAPGPIGPAIKKATLQFANLPPSTTFPFLCEKLSQCGQVLSLQFTTPGCAVATFSHPAHAERCFHTYNGMTVEGCRINVALV